MATIPPMAQVKPNIVTSGGMQVQLIGRQNKPVNKTNPASPAKTGGLITAGGSPTFSETGGGLLSAASTPSSVAPYQTTPATVTKYDPTKASSTGYTANTAQSKGYTANTTNANTYDPTLRNVDGNDTVSGQMTGLLSQNSPYMQLARTGAAQTAARRGLLNSSMAAGAGEAAAIQSALPIAQQDAQTYYSQGRANQDATNTAGQFNAGEKNRVGMFNTGERNRASEFGADAFNRGEMFNADAKNTAGQFGAEAYNKAQTFNAGAANEAGQFNSGEANRTSMFNAEAANTANRDKFTLDADIAKINADYSGKGLLQSNELANERAIKGKEAENLAFSQYIKGVADINATDMSGPAKIAATDKLWAEYQKNTQIGAALGGATIKDGVVTWGDTTPASSDGGNNTGGTPSDSTGGNTIGNTGTPANQGDPNDYFSYKTVDQMPSYMRDQYKAKYGDVNPPEVKVIGSMVTDAFDRFGEALQGPRSLHKNEFEYRKYVLDELKKMGYNFSYDQVFKAATADGNLPKEVVDALTPQNTKIYGRRS